MRRALRLTALVAASAFAIGACGSDDDSDSSDTDSDVSVADDSAPGTVTDETGADDTAPADSVCEPIRVIADLNDRSAEVIVSGGEYAALRELLVDAAPQLEAAYDRIAELEPELAEDAELLASFTEASVDVATEVDSLAELNAELLKLPDGLAASEAGVALDKYAEERCGVSTGSG